MAGHVFISHGSENSDDAGAIAAFLEARGVRTWIAPRDVRPGTDYSEELQKAIEACIAFVVLVSETSNTSPYVRAETEMAFSTEKPIFPVRRSDIKPAAGLAFFLKIRHWTDAYGPGADAAMERLARELEALSGIEARPATPVPQPATPTPAPPPPPPPPPPTPTPPADEARLRAAIGDNADYYLRKWAEMDAKSRSYDWNWPACLLNFCWFAYRKMWLAAAAIALVYIVTTPFFDPTDKQLFRIVTFFVIGISFATGAFGNTLYRKQIARLVAGTAGMEQDAALAHLRRQGGTSVPGLIGSIVAILLLGSAATMVLGPPQPRPAPPPGPGPGPQPQPEPQPQPAPDQVVLDRDYLVGRWGDQGDCTNVSEFFADGRWASNGGTGNWSLIDNELVVTGPGGATSVEVTPVDRNTMMLRMPDGQAGRSTRC